MRAEHDFMKISKVETWMKVHKLVIGYIYYFYWLQYALVDNSLRCHDMGMFPRYCICEDFSEGNPSVTCEFPLQRAINVGFDVSLMGT